MIQEETLANRNRFYDQVEAFLIELSDIIRFTGHHFRALFKKPFETEEFFKQSYDSGYKSLALIGITAFIMGLVLTIQTRPVLAKLGAEAWLPGMVMVSIVREICPVITALIFAGKVGSGIGAELSSMRVTEQIDAMEVSGTNPMKYLVTTRVLSATIMVPVLVIFADFIALIGSYIGMNMHENITFSLFFNQAFDQMHYYDLIPAFIKTFFFGFAIGIIGCYKGYYADQGTRGVGRAANSAVVTSSLVIFILDLMAVQISEIII